MQTDWDFCTMSLRQVSRTFSQPIEVLRGDLRKAVTCGYLLCRVADAIEDNESFTLAERDERYRGFHEILHDAKDATEFEHSWVGIEGSPPQEIELCSQIRRVIAVLDTVPEQMRDAVLPWVTEMARGMQIYSHRSADDEGIIAPSTSGDLERYCYFVAGTVGHMLTELFVSEMGVAADSTVARRLAENAEAFGTGLQLVNILKDITDDLSRGWSFIPRSNCRSQSLRYRDLVEPRNLPAAHRAVGPLFELTRVNLDRALNYALAVPPTHREIRMFCLLPLWLAVETIALAYGNDSMFIANDAVKLSRREVEEIIARCTTHCDDDARLREDYEAMWSPLTRLMIAGSAMGEWPQGIDAA